VNKPITFGTLAQGKKLSIICADDVYYNLEALKIVFHQLGLTDFCQFVNNG
jgi:CheY-like chemotaxis protein